MVDGVSSEPDYEGSKLWHARALIEWWHTGIFDGNDLTSQPRALRILARISQEHPQLRGWPLYLWLWERCSRYSPTWEETKSLFTDALSCLELTKI